MDHKKDFALYMYVCVYVSIENDKATGTKCKQVLSLGKGYQKLLFLEYFLTLKIYKN